MTRVPLNSRPSSFSTADRRSAAVSNSTKLPLDRQPNFIDDRKPATYSPSTITLATRFGVDDVHTRLTGKVLEILMHHGRVSPYPGVCACVCVSMSHPGKGRARTPAENIAWEERVARPVARGPRAHRGPVQHASAPSAAWCRIAPIFDPRGSRHRARPERVGRHRGASQEGENTEGPEGPETGYRRRPERRPFGQP